MEAKATRPRYYLGTALLILLVGFGLRIWDLGGPSLWHDEIYTARRAEASLREGLDLTLQSGNQTPLYFASLHVLPVGDDTLLRYPSVLTGVLGIALMMRLIVRFYGNHNLALLVGAGLALNPYHILISRTARPYALLFAVTVAVAYFFLLLVHRQRTRWVWTAFTVGSAAAYITHYFAGALPVAQYLLFSFILRRNRRFFRQWIAAQALAGLPLLGWIVALLRQEELTIGIGWIPTPGLDDIPLSFWNMMAGYDGLIDESGLVRWLVVPAFLIGTVGLLAGLAAAWRGRRRDRVALYWGLLLVVPFILMFAVSMFRPLYVDRYFTVFLPAVILLMLLGLRRVPGRWVSAGLVGVVVITGLANFLVTFEGERIERQGWRRAADYILKERQPGDALLVESPSTLWTFLYYFEDDEMARAWLDDGSGEAQQPADQYERAVNRIWAISIGWTKAAGSDQDIHRLGTLPDFDPFDTDQFLIADWLTEHAGRVLHRRDFAGVKVFLLDATGLQDGAVSTPGDE